MKTRFAIFITGIGAMLFLCTATLQAQDTRESAEFKLAVRLYNDKLYAQAEEQFTSFITRFPKSASSVEALF